MIMKFTVILWPFPDSDQRDACELPPALAVDVLSQKQVFAIQTIMRSVMASTMPTVVAEQLSIQLEQGRFRMHAYLGSVFMNGRKMCAEFMDEKGTFFHLIANTIEAENMMRKLVPGTQVLFAFLHTFA